MFNPFKWHVIKYRNAYICRRSSLFGWQYLDRTDGFCWTSLGHGFKYGSHPDRTSADMTIRNFTVERIKNV